MRSMMAKTAIAMIGIGLGAAGLVPGAAAQRSGDLDQPRTASEAMTASTDTRPYDWDMEEAPQRPRQVGVSPRFVIEADGFTVVDETGPDWPFSDEVMVIWNSDNGVGARSRIFEDMDSGDYQAFHHLQSCMAPIGANSWRDAWLDGHAWGCKPEGTAGPLNIDVVFLETDASGFTFCGGSGRGPRAPIPGSSCKNTDFIGDYQQTWTEAQLVQMLASPGASKSHTVRLEDCGCGVSGGINASLPDYDLHFTITRVADVPVYDHSPITG